MKFNEDIWEKFYCGSLLPKIDAKEINLKEEQIPSDVINRVNKRIVYSVEENHNREIHAYNSELQKILVKKFR